MVPLKLRDMETEGEAARGYYLLPQITRRMRLVMNPYTPTLPSCPRLRHHKCYANVKVTEM